MAFVKSVLAEYSDTGRRESNFKSVLFMAVQAVLCEHNEVCQNGHELDSVPVSAENLKQQDNSV